MNSVNKTMYIPLYGKSYVSKNGLFLKDKKAEEIWEKEGFPLKGKSSSKWLAYYMGIRSAVFDQWLTNQMENKENDVILHLGCGMDSRVNRVGTGNCCWYDVDFPEVIKVRRKYFSENDSYKMIEGDLKEDTWLSQIPDGKNAIVLMEGVSMYLSFVELEQLFKNLKDHFGSVSILMDAYTSFAAKASKYKNPVKEVGVTTVYGIDDPKALESAGYSFVKEYEMTPEYFIAELKGMEQKIFRRIYGGKMSKKLYKMYEYR